jgi:hypothetical protein
MEKIKQLKYLNNYLIEDLQKEMGDRTSLWDRLDVDDIALGNFTFFHANIYWFTKSLC